MTEEIEDRVLVELLVRTGDRATFGMLYDRHTAYLYGLALRLCGGDEAKAQDVVHDAWVAAVPRFPKFRWESRLATWLAGFVVNCARASFRSERHESLGEPREEGRLDMAAESAVDRVDLERALATLPSGARQVLVLHDIEGWTHREIARHLEIQPGTSKSQLSRARALIRERLSTVRSDT